MGKRGKWTGEDNGKGKKESTNLGDWRVHPLDTFIGICQSNFPYGLWFLTLLFPVSCYGVTTEACPESYRRVPPLKKGVKGDLKIQVSSEYPVACCGDLYFLLASRGYIFLGFADLCGKVVFPKRNTLEK